MKKLILSVIIITSFLACSQEKNQIMQNTNITADNIVEEISQEIKHYASEKIYGLGYSNDKCYFEMFVDGVRVYKKSNSIITGSTAVEINHLLFKSGKHTVSYKMYPMLKEEKHYPEKPLYTLVDDSILEFDLYSYDKKNKGADDIEHLKYEVPKIETKVTPNYSTYKFEGTGKTYYEGSFDINVDVPYELHPPFENAQDLRKMDKKELEKKLLTKYKEIWSVYQNKESDNIARIEYDMLKNLFISNYASKETIKENWDVFYNVYKSPSFQMQPIEKYKLEFFAEGKMVALMLDTTDNRFRGNTALWAKVDYDGGLRPLFLNRYFYIPQGETEFKVY
ncbi:hypothetical protein [Chryseobacterium oryctis]|uniref:Uncharacterized protein n=1 Tax=Chryseobacterium oryctis TaxID=2952618 RepID=A0ABT3HRS3_9FLAO|nr:hypothetical protein [Chryseobacterium oryctis]MCW3162486.1 hypothetical protein [Chryseobacterium oryctis]